MQVSSTLSAADWQRTARAVWSFMGLAAVCIKNGAWVISSSLVSERGVDKFHFRFLWVASYARNFLYMKGSSPCKKGNQLFSAPGGVTFLMPHWTFYIWLLKAMLRKWKYPQRKAVIPASYLCQQAASRSSSSMWRRDGLVQRATDLLETSLLGGEGPSWLRELHTETLDSWN